MAENCATVKTDELTSLPNIGAVVAQKLKAAGRLRALATRAEDAPCMSMLSGLEGAIRGVRWHVIPKHEREALWWQYQARCEDEKVPRS
jgi:DNA transformation protein